MFRIALILLITLSAVSESRSKPLFRERFLEAREVAREKDWTEAIGLFQALLKDVDKTPKSEIVMLELAQVYFASGSMARTAEMCVRFKKDFPFSLYRPQMDHLHAVSLWSQGLFEESYEIYAGRNWEDLRAMPATLRARVHDILWKALKGAQFEFAAKAVLAERNGILVDKNGSPLLKGSIRDIVEDLETEEGWSALLSQVSDPTIKKRVIAGVEEKKHVPEKKKLRSIWGGVGVAAVFASNASGATIFSQSQLAPRLQLLFPLSTAGSAVRIHASYDALGTTSLAGTTLSWLHTGFKFDAAIAGGPVGFRFVLQMGFFYMVSVATPSSLDRLSDCLGLDLYPVFRYAFANGSSIGIWGKFAPYIQSMQRIDGRNYITALGIDYRLPLKGERFWLDVFLELENTRFDVGTLFTSQQISFGTKLDF